MFTNTEIYSFEDEVWFRTPDGMHQQLKEDNREFIRYMMDRIESFYPTAYDKLKEEYAKCAPNISYYQYRIVRRFCRCNFGIIDDVKDIGSNGRMNFERVQCPLRGECSCEGVICNPKFNSKISDAEERVLKMIFRGKTKEEIAEELRLSIHTVNNHIRNAYSRIGVHEKAEFIDYAHKNKLWQEE